MERLVKHAKEQAPPSEPTQELLQEVFNLYKEALPETIDFGLTKTAQDVRRKHFYWLKKEEVLKILAEEWLNTDQERISDWAAAWNHSNRRGILCSSLEKSKNQIVEGECASLSHRVVTLIRRDLTCSFETRSTASSKLWRRVNL